MTRTATTTPGGADTAWSWSDGRPACFAGPAGSLTVTAPGGSDLYRMPGVREIDALVHASRPVEGDFTLSVRAEVRPDGGTGRFADAGGVLVTTADGWAKFCVERAPSGDWTLVTVVSAPYSDEAAGPVLDGPRAELTVVREGRRAALLHRPDPEGEPRFVRTFTVPEGPLRVGLFAQAPFSASCTAVFDGVRLDPEPLRDRR
ncbi:DUF1349 domain-containing protein [Streptomyces sp. SID12488]|uniref:DUF1349 domain-containing protein n=1 Tax=Streptomyces sp. SID12488 TaxID=2706040 RepID=UPI0013DB2742|nr:DUF1349 domain-containing protein [Streptomyces sp. SID12488]